MSGFGGLSCLVLMISISELTAVTVPALVVVVVGGKGSSWLDLHRARQICSCSFLHPCQRCLWLHICTRCFRKSQKQSPALKHVWSCFVAVALCWTPRATWVHVYLAVQVVCICILYSLWRMWCAFCGARNVYIVLIVVHLCIGKCSEPLPGRSSV